MVSPATTFASPAQLALSEKALSMVPRKMFFEDAVTDEAMATMAKLFLEEDGMDLASPVKCDNTERDKPSPGGVGMSP
eukprot:1849427-Rhodomonas_salina.1